MQVRIRVFGHVVVDNYIDTFDVHSTTKKIRRDKNTLLEIFELSVAGDAFLLRHGAVDGDGREVLLHKKVGESTATLHRFDEDDDLVELQRVEEIEEFTVLLVVLEFYVMLRETVECQLRLIINIYLKCSLFQLLTELHTLSHFQRAKLRIQIVSFMQRKYNVNSNESIIFIFFFLITVFRQVYEEEEFYSSVL